jgi:hypothetical protein
MISVVIPAHNEEAVIGPLRIGRVHVAFDEHELAGKLDGIEQLAASERIAPHASPQLIGAIRQFVMSKDVGQRRGQRPPSERALDVALRG